MILTNDQIINLASKIQGARLDNIRYAADSVVRKYRELPLSVLQNDLSISDAEVIIIAGIGTLTCTDAGYKFNSNSRIVSDEIIPISSEAANIRYSICLSCDKYNSNTDKCGTCGCGTEMKIQSKSPVFKCPSNKWP